MAAYTDRSNTGYAGTNTRDGSYFGVHQCKDGEYITRFEGRSGWYVNQLGATCSDGQKIGPFGYSGGGSPFSLDGPFRNLELIAEGWVDGIPNFGDPQHNNRVTLTCPNDRYLVGFEGRSGEFLAGQFRGLCGVKKDEYCVDNLEKDLCRTSNVSILNKACAKNMTATCKNRKDEIDETVIYNYCQKNKGDPFCSCFIDIPPDIPPAISGLSKCWNKTCAESGYIPKNMRNLACPPTTYCKQIVGAEGSNVISSNSYVQDCGTRVLPNTIPTTTTTDSSGNTKVLTNSAPDTTPKTVFNDPTKSPYVPDDPATITNNTKASILEFVQKNLLVILVVFLVVVGLIVAAFSGDDEVSPPPVQQQFMPPYSPVQPYSSMPPTVPQNYPMPQPYSPVPQ